MERPRPRLSNTYRTSLFLRRAVHPLFDFVWPTDCAACGNPVDALQRHGVCSRCWAALTPLGRAQCRRCALPQPVSTDLLERRLEMGCDVCAERGTALDGMLAALLYDATARAVLLRAKLEARRELMSTLGDMLAAAADTDDRFRACDLVVAVPSHPWPYLRRGFNPAAILAGAVARRLGRPVARFALRRRWRVYGSAKRLGRAARHRMLQEAFVARKTIQGRHILLVDDVMTTGATLEICARVARIRGARSVRAAVWARTPRPDGKKG